MVSVYFVNLFKKMERNLNLEDSLCKKILFSLNKTNMQYYEMNLQYLEIVCILLCVSLESTAPPLCN